MAKKEAQGAAVGKIILMGEHAVVYGKPAVAIPFPKVSIKTTITETAGQVELDCLYHQGLLAEAPKELLGLHKLISKLADSLNEKAGGFKIKIESTIPPGRGMGSSAAVAAAVTRALHSFFDRPLAKSALLNWIEVSEKVVHGSPSGIDGAVVGGGKSLYFIKGKEPKILNFKTSAYLIAADTGQIGNTGEAVASVKQFLKAEPVLGQSLIEKLGHLAAETKLLLAADKTQELGNAMTEAHRSLAKLGVSNEKLDKLVKAALDNGALGAKLTGGGRGGCIIALARTESKAEVLARKLLVAGAKNTWCIRLKGGFS